MEAAMTLDDVYGPDNDEFPLEQARAYEAGGAVRLVAATMGRMWRAGACWRDE